MKQKEFRLFCCGYVLYAEVLPGRLLLISLTMFLLAGFVMPTFASPDARTALVIGNNDYREAPLTNSVNDASDMADALEELGFDVIYEENADKPTMRNRIREFGRTITKGGIGLFFYTGHGLQISGRNYLIPTDSSFGREYDVTDEAVNADLVLRAMEDAHNRLNIVILDAGRDNPFYALSRSISPGLARMDAPVGSIIAHSTTPGSIALDGEGRNSLYTQYLLPAVKTPNLSIELIFKQVRVQVAQESNGKQIPWEESSLVGDFYFTLINQPESVTLQPQVAVDKESQREIVVWQGISDSQNTSDFEQYLQDFPEGYFIQNARIRLDQLRISQDEQNLDDDANSASETNAISPPKKTGLNQLNDISYLLFQAKSAYDILHLTTPAGDNAYEYYKRVLHLDPHNSEANHGIQRIVNRYLELANESVQNGHHDSAEQYLNRALSIAPASQSILEAKASIRGKPDYPNIRSARAAYDRRELSKQRYAEIERKFKLKIRAEIAELKLHYRDGQITKAEYKRLANGVKRRYK